VHLGHAYATLPDNRQCCDFIIVVPQSDVVGVVAGSLLSYGPIAPNGTRNKPIEPTLVYER
jgi:hypothetical protein